MALDSSTVRVVCVRTVLMKGSLIDHECPERIQRTLGLWLGGQVRQDSHVLLSRQAGEMVDIIYTDIIYYPEDLEASFLPQEPRGPDPSATIPIPYEQALLEQGAQLMRRDRVHCLSCLIGSSHGVCRCKFVDVRGKLAGIGSSIYFIPRYSATPGCMCRVQSYPRHRSEPLYPRPCQYRIEEIGPAPRNDQASTSGVYIRCKERACPGNAFFPYGIGKRGGSPEWVNVRPIANLCQPFVKSIIRQVRKLHERRACNASPTDLCGMLLNIYGIRTLCCLRITCKGLEQECTLRMFALVCIQ